MSFRPLIFGCGLIVGLALVSACSSPTDLETTEAGSEPAPSPDAPQQPDPPSMAELRAQADLDPESALRAMDGCVADYEREYTFWLLYAQATDALFLQKAADGSLGPGLATDLLEDGAEAYRTALRLNSADADVHLALAENRRQAGEPEAAWQAAEAACRALNRAGLIPGAEARTAAAQFGVRYVAAAIQAGEPVPGAAREIQIQLQQCTQAGHLDAFLPLSDLYAWQGLTTRAAEPLAELLGADPTRADAYGRLSSLGLSDRNLQVALLEQLRMDRPDSADALWYLGEARYLQGRECRVAADYLKAMECWDRAEESFLQAMNLRPDYETTCRDWLHIVRTQRGWTLRDEGRISEAAETFAATLEGDPERLEADSTPESLHLGIDAVTADFYRNGDLRGARRFLRRVCAVDDSDSNWTNNLGFFCRELGTAATARGETDKALGYYLDSWDAYTRCVEIASEDPRLVNDRALIAVYYLDEHHDFAEQELHRAIDLGVVRMAQWPEDVPEEERLYVEEAIGDAWENLAYLELVRRERIGESATYLENSKNYYPYEQRNGVQTLLQRLEALRAQEE